MARRVMRRSSGFRRSPGRLTEWFGTTLLSDWIAVAANTFQVVVVQTSAELAKRPFTITRTVGELAVQSDQNAAVEVPFGVFGGIVISDKAAATGVTAIPDPTTEVSSDEWFVYTPWHCEGSASTNVGRPIERYAIDSRGQRKVEDGEQYTFMIGNASAADGALFQVNLRLLVKLS